MIRINLAKTSFLAASIFSLCSLTIGTGCGAQDFNTSQAPAAQPQVKSAELESADSRVETSKTKLDQARKVLSAAKASLKAAEAEFKATKADRDAIALRNTAQQLADASGFASNPVVDPVRQIIVPPNGNRLTPVAVPPASVTTQNSVTTTKSTVVDFNGAPAPAGGDLTPLSPNLAPTSEPNLIP
jgi:hypothetical protein